MNVRNGHEHLFRGLRRKTGGRLVQHDQLGIRHKRPRHPQHLTLPATEGSRLFPHLLLQDGEKLEGLVNLLPHLGFGPCVSPHFQILQNRQRGENVPKLRDIAKPLLHLFIRFQIGHVLTFPGDRPAINGHVSHDGLHQGGFAGAVGADDGHHFLLFQIDGNAVQDLRFTVSGGNILSLEDFHLTRPISSSFRLNTPPEPSHRFAPPKGCLPRSSVRNQGR